MSVRVRFPFRVQCIIDYQIITVISVVKWGVKKENRSDSPFFYLTIVVVFNNK